MANPRALKFIFGKGLSKAGTQVALFDFGGMSMERLRALAEGKPLNPGVVDVKGLGEGE